MIPLDIRAYLEKKRCLDIQFYGTISTVKIYLISNLQRCAGSLLTKVIRVYLLQESFHRREPCLISRCT